MYIYHNSTLKSFTRDYNKLNADLRIANYTTYKKVQSFITKDNRYIITYTDDPGYNVYDITNDEWLLDKCIQLDPYQTYSDSAKSIMVNDELMILSEGENLLFYYIPTQDLKSFMLVKKHTYTTQDLYYSYHGMCCIGFKHTIDKKNKINQFDVKILLIGGSKNNDFFQSLLIVDIIASLPFYQLKPLFADKGDESKLSDEYDYNYNDMIKVTKETKVDAKKLWKNYCDENSNIKKTLLDDSKTYRWHNFGTQCLTKTNSGANSDTIVFLFGGSGSFVQHNYLRAEDDSKSLFVLNITNYQFKKLENVCIYSC